MCIITIQKLFLFNSKSNLKLQQINCISSNTKSNVKANIIAITLVITMTITIVLSIANIIAITLVKVFFK